MRKKSKSYFGKKVSVQDIENAKFGKKNIKHEINAKNVMNGK